MAQNHLPATTELSLLLFNVGHTVDRITAGDQTKGIKAVLSSIKAKKRNEKQAQARNLFVLASDRGQYNQLAEFTGSLENDGFKCNGTVGIFKRRTTTNVTTTNVTTEFLELRDREVFAKVTVRLQGGIVNVLVVSYHGRHRRPGTVGTLTDEEKIALLNQLIETADEMKVDNSYHAVIIGGDFNLSLSKASSEVPTVSGQTLTYAPCYRPPPEINNANDEMFKDAIDFVVYWPDTHLRVIRGHPKVLKWIGETFTNLDIPNVHQQVVTPRRPNNLNLKTFDHPRLLYRFTVSRPN